MSPRALRRSARRCRSTYAGRCGTQPSRASPSTERTARLAESEYPEDLKYHTEHDWARIDGDEATFGITWYAQDSLGEVVFFEAPKVGSKVTKDEPYTEIESVKAVSDVISP